MDQMIVPKIIFFPQNEYDHKKSVQKELRKKIAL